MMATGPIKAEALADLPLLAQVVKHKETFYPAAWAQYELAPWKPPPGAEAGAAGRIERDYKNMGVMLFGEPPRFYEIIEVLAELEKDING